MKKSTKIIFSLLLLGILFIISSIYPSQAYGEVDCLDCHKALAEEKVVHPAVGMGCTGCHGAIDASEVPHKKTNKIDKGLSSEQPELCYGCHDKAMFSKKTVHAAVGMGCTGCHNPHSSKNAKLLISEPPGLCFNCHEKKKFEGKTVHSPVEGGMCITCHSPHSTDGPKLLLSGAPDLCFTCHDKAEFSRKNVHSPVEGGMCLDCHTAIHASKQPALFGKKINTICLGCHPDIAKSLHAIRGFKGAGHPLDGKKDPVRTDKTFSCAGCHNPHSSDSPRLFRYQASTPFALCKYCHTEF